MSAFKYKSLLCIQYQYLLLNEYYSCAIETLSGLQNMNQIRGFYLGLQNYSVMHSVSIVRRL